MQQEQWHTKTPPPSWKCLSSVLITQALPRLPQYWQYLHQNNGGVNSAFDYWWPGLALQVFNPQAPLACSNIFICMYVCWFKGKQVQLFPRRAGWRIRPLKALWTQQQTHVVEVSETGALWQGGFDILYKKQTVSAGCVHKHTTSPSLWRPLHVSSLVLLHGEG